MYTPMFTLLYTLIYTLMLAIIVHTYLSTHGNTCLKCFNSCLRIFTQMSCVLSYVNMFTLSIHMFALKFSYVYTRLYTHVSLKRKNLLKDILLRNLLHTFVLVNIKKPWSQILPFVNFLRSLVLGLIR